MNISHNGHSPATQNGTDEARTIPASSGEELGIQRRNTEILGAGEALPERETTSETPANPGAGQRKVALRAESVEIRLRIPKTTLQALEPFQKRAGSVSAMVIVEKMIQRHVDAANVGCSLAPIPQRAYGIAVNVAKWAGVPVNAVLEDCVTHPADQLITDPDWLWGAVEKWLNEGTVGESRRTALGENRHGLKPVLAQQAEKNPLKHAFKL